MPRYAAVLDIAKTAGTAALVGASVAARIPGTTGPTPQPLYSGPTGTATLTNPFTTTSGAVEFYLAAPQAVDVQITPAGAPRTTISSVKCATTTPIASAMTANGKVVNWFLS